MSGDEEYLTLLAKLHSESLPEELVLVRKKHLAIRAALQIVAVAITSNEIMARRVLARQDCHFLPGGRVSVRAMNGAVAAALRILAVRSQQIHGLVDGDARRHRSGGACGCFGLAAMPFFLLDTKTFICLSILIQAAHGAVGRCLDHLAGMLRYEKESPIARSLNGKNLFEESSMPLKETPHSFFVTIEVMHQVPW